jgi:hypothetical protein
LFELLCPSLQTSPEPNIARAASDLNQFELAVFRDNSDFERIVHLDVDPINLKRSRPKMASPYIARRVAESARSSDRAKLQQFLASPHISKYDSGHSVLLRGLGGIRQGLLDSIIAKGGYFRVRDLNVSSANVALHYLAPRSIRYYGVVHEVHADHYTDDCDSSSSDGSICSSDSTSSNTDGSSTDSSGRSSSSDSDDVISSDSSYCNGSCSLAQPNLLVKMSLMLQPKALCCQQLQQCVDALAAGHSDIIVYVPTTSSKEFETTEKLTVTEAATATALRSIQQYAIEINLGT